MRSWQQAAVVVFVAIAHLVGLYNLLVAATERAAYLERPLPEKRFFLFGMGLRDKYVHRDGMLVALETGQAVSQWQLDVDEIILAEYTVKIKTKQGASFTIVEDEQAVWLSEPGRERTALPGTQHPLRLPRFEDHPQAELLRILHHEVLIGVTRQGPVPNPLVYRKPWYRDAAVMAMVLKVTGNLDQIRDWILSLREPYDFNNGVPEPDNLGQALFLISLVADKSHPLVPIILEEAERRAVRKDGVKYLEGLTDGARHPVYQTKWLKFGLKALGLPDDWTIPAVADSYSALFWMDFKDQHVRGHDAADRRRYPYLAWACAHFHGTEPGPFSGQAYPLTWEAEASAADYAKMSAISPEFAVRRVAAPHAWHAAEAFLYLLELPRRP
ncbi:MAG: hypothetical protein NZ899_04850 [Thermoguttaceae bacterium]|nr:hypothetical protein [Thermoguttaceae bacterium]